MPQDRDDPPPAASTSGPTAAGFNETFSAVAASPGIGRVWQLAAPDLPPQIEPFSFISAGLQGEARRNLPTAGLMHRVAVTATAPGI